MTTPPPNPPRSAPPTWRRWLVPIIIGVIATALNVLAYFVVPPNLAERLGGFGYLGVFAVTAIANATVVVPVPYYGVVARLAQESNLLGVVLAGALGSTLGESVAFFVGRSGRGAVNDTGLYRWVQQQMRRPWRAFLVLFAFAAPPNPAFDVAGLTAGAMGLPFWMFASAVFLGRIIRIGIIALIGAQLVGG